MIEPRPAAVTYKDGFYMITDEVGETVTVSDPAQACLLLAHTAGITPQQALLTLRHLESDQ